MSTNPIVAAYHRGKWALLVRGLLGIALGIVIIARPLESVAAFALVIALWAVFDGIANIVRGFELRSVLPHWGVLLLAGVVSLVFGVAALYYYPALSLAFAVAWVGWWLISGGALAVYIAVQERKAEVPSGWTMATGIISIGFGIFALVYPGVTLASLMGVIAGFGIVGGIALLVGAGKMQAFEQDVRHAAQPSRA